MERTTEKYIKKKAKEEGIKLPDNYESCLQKYYDITEKYGYKLVFRAGRGLNINSLNANAGFGNMSIIATPEFAYQLIAHYSDELNTKILITLGHEFTHKDGNDLFPFNSKYIFIKNGFKFVNWVNEVHADYGAVKKIFNCSRNKLIGNFEYKLKHKKEDFEDCSHPSNYRRLEYVINYDFDEKLIRKIAEDTGMINQKLLTFTINHFKKIILK